MSGCAIVTGAQRNIGAAIAVRLASAGMPVVVNYPNVDAAQEAESVAARILASGGRARAIEADVSEEKAVDVMIATAVAEFGSIAVLVNNAATAVARRVAWDDETIEDWDQITRVNVTGAFLCTRAATPHMNDPSGGAIVNVSSITPLVGFTQNLPYVTSKAALIGMTRSLARELGPKGVRVNAVLPGAISTPQQRDVFGESQDWLQQQALKIQGEPDDVASAVAFLVSSQARFIAGQCLIVDGGVVFG